VEVMNKIHLQAIVITACIAGASAVMYSGHDGWGWLILIAILVMA
jgi:hypothetical protein